MNAAPQTPTSVVTNDAIAARLDDISRRLDLLVAHQANNDGFLAEMAPIGRVALDGVVEILAELERDGWFAFAREVRRIGERVVRAYSPEDVARLGDHIVGIFDTVRNLTQPDVLALVNQATTALHEADEADPKGAWGLVRAARDPDVRKGIGVLVAVLGQVGRAADRMGRSAAPTVRIDDGAPGAEPADARGSWTSRIAPRRGRAAEPPVSETRPTTAPSAGPAQVANQMPPGYGPDGFLLDSATWTRDLAQQLATLVPLTLTDAHWQVIEWARGERAEHGASPNIRRLSVGTGVPVRDLYALFPARPGVLVAMLAGIPKPGGCL